MRTIGNAVCGLHLTYILHDRCKLRFGDLGLWRHIAVRPVVLPHARFGGEKERTVVTMAGLVHIDLGQSTLATHAAAVLGAAFGL